MIALEPTGWSCDRFTTFVDDLSKELQQKQDRDFQRQVLTLQARAVPAGGSQGTAMQPSIGHNRQGICYDWDGVKCTGKGKDCPYDHPPGTASKVYLNKLAGKRPSARRY